MRQQLKKTYRTLNDDRSFLQLLGEVEGLVSKILSLAMVIVILVTVWDLLVFLIQTIRSDIQNPGYITDQIISIFGLFLNILIALEVLENITAYLRNHAVQMELVIATSLIAVARKIIILDLDKIDGSQLLGLGFGVLALSCSYWLVKQTTKNDPNVKL